MTDYDETSFWMGVLFTIVTILSVLGLYQIVEAVVAVTP